MWLNEVDQGAFIGNEDGDKVEALCGMMGYALLRGLAALDHAGELKADTAFLDIPIVISSMLEWSSDLGQYGIENGDALTWRQHAIAYFKRGAFEASRGIHGTAKLLESDKQSDENELPTQTDKDPWKWTSRLKDYKKSHGTPSIGGRHYDITKMTRKERAGHAFDGKDPLKDLPEKALKADLLDF